MDAITITLILFGAFAIFAVVYTKVTEIVSERKAKKEQKQKEDALIHSLKTGEWKFPSREFYTRCIDKKIRNLDDKFYIQKARLVAEGILHEKQIPQAYISSFCSDEQLIKAFNEAKESIAQEKAREKALQEKKQEEWNRVPHRGNPDKAQEHAISLASKLVGLSGVNKRKTMLEDSLSILNKNIQDKVDTQQAFAILGSAISNSAYEEKQRDWATAGGIASAIAGPVAGAAVAINTMEENRAIAARNAENRAAVQRLGNSISSLSVDSSASVETMRDTANKIYAEIASINEKVVLEDADTATLENFVTITAHKITKKKTNIIEVSITLENTFVPDVPEDVKIVVDGMYIVDIYAGDTRVGTANIPLPLYGVECGKTARATGYCINSMAQKCEYSMKVIRRKLWAMEL